MGRRPLMYLTLSLAVLEALWLIGNGALMLMLVWGDADPERPGARTGDLALAGVHLALGAVVCGAIAGVAGLAVPFITNSQRRPWLALALANIPILIGALISIPINGYADAPFWVGLTAVSFTLLAGSLLAMPRHKLSARGE